MTHHTRFQISLLLSALALSPLAGAQSMSKTDFNASKTRISTDYKADKAACASFAGNAKDICVEQAKAKQSVARAELEYGYSASPSDRRKLMTVKADAQYAVAKEMCDDKAGNDKAVCVKEAKAVKVKALADVKMAKEVGEAKKEAVVDKTDADYQVALTKCDSLAGDMKAGCVSAAKSKFGKS